MSGKVAPLFDDLPHSKKHAILAGLPHRAMVCAPVAADPAAIADQKFTWQYAIEWRLVRAGTARYDVDSGNHLHSRAICISNLRDWYPSCTA